MLALAACAPTANESAPTFARVPVDAENSGDCKAIGDIDGDGKADLIVGGATLAWYRNADWRKVTIAKAAIQFTTDCQTKDLNGDGRIDIVVGDGDKAGNVVWFENTGSEIAWPRHTIGTHPHWVHDVEVADFDADGRPDVLTHGRGTHVWYQTEPGTWVDRDLSALDKTKEGIGIGDVDRDGRVDIVQGGWWFANPGSRAGAWTPHHFASGYDGGSFTAAVADLDDDGRPDIALAEQHKRHELAWYAAPADPRQGQWTRNVIATDMGAHKLAAADMNGDGRADLVVGLELAELSIYLNGGGATPSFAKKTVNTTGCHNTRVGDIDGDGAVDIFCANYIDHPPVDLWLNQGPPAASARGWHYIEVDASRKKMASDFPAFGLAFGDIDRDGLVDIVSGKYFYRNPAPDLEGKWQRSTFPVDADAMLVTDVDGDGQPDVIAQSLPDVYWLKPNVDGSRWTAHKVASLPATAHVNSQGYRLAAIVPGSTRPEIVVAAGDGVWYLRIPAKDPARGPWQAVKIASGTTEDMLAAGDIDGDGLVDVVASDASGGKTIHWYRNPGNGAGAWTRHVAGEVTDWGDRAELADIDGDGRLDIVVATENGKAAGAATYWFQAPPDPGTQPWTRRTIATQGSTNSMSVGTLDGSVAVVTGEHRGQRRVRIWKSSDGGRTWRDTLVGGGRESHLGARLVDLNGDGAPDIVSIAWDGFENLHVWRNDSRRAPAAGPASASAATR